MYLIVLIITIIVLSLLGLSIFYYARSCRKLEATVTNHWGTISSIYQERLNTLYTAAQEAARGGTQEVEHKTRRVINATAWAITHRDPTHLPAADTAVDTIIIPALTSSRQGDGGASIGFTYNRTQPQLTQAVEDYNAAVLEYRRYASNWHKIQRAARRTPHEWALFTGYERENMRAA